ncbi:polyprenyl synthetase family protein [Paenibacillus motobuensis]|uniref:polyprenyl synthetase family protein n=1 Tax=Paenibacillus TaxID=44249 RepID=UPI00203D41BC|nr:polyprenyl synthetase family protein [Paenibacillus lutimineralis]MCM3649811.1 polyprenyl synthetase family protein [Paenibacillus motobuensis]
MEQFAEMLEIELRESLRTYFSVPHLYEHALACLEDKMQESSMLLGKMTVLHFRMFAGQDTRDIYRAAAAIELMMLSLDIIDDIQDKDNGKMAWNQLPSEIALNIGIGMLTLSGQLILETGFPSERKLAAAQLLNQGVLIAVNGQMTDLYNDVSSEEEYIEMVSQKSAALLVTASMIGTVLATGEWIEEVRLYAEQLGIAAQIKNDIRDLLNWDDKNDFLNRKKTLPTLYLLQSVSDEERWIIDYFEGHLDFADVVGRRQEVERIIESTGTLIYTSVRMRTHYYRYLEHIERLNLEPHWKEKMLSFAE